VRFRLQPNILALLVVLPWALRSAWALTPVTVGVGPHGYDFLIGTWSCKNSVPSALEGPTTTTFVITRTTNGALSIHVTATGFDAMGYIVYDSKTKTWWNPSMLATGGYGSESSQQNGRKTVWIGLFTNPSSGKTLQVRDTYTFLNAKTYTDLYQANVAGTWKTQGNSTCTKTSGT
jgi:hypothetical protein